MLSKQHCAGQGGGSNITVFLRMFLDLALRLTHESSQTAPCLSCVLHCLAAGTGVRADILDEYTTRMWMQLKPDLDRQKLARELCLLDPYMLLNLRKLK
jgi:hypothetical protein